MAGNEGISPRTGRPLGAVCFFRQEYKKSGRPKRNGHSCVGKLFGLSSSRSGVPSQGRSERLRATLLLRRRPVQRRNLPCRGKFNLLYLFEVTDQFDRLDRLPIKRDNALPCEIAILSKASEVKSSNVVPRLSVTMTCHRPEPQRRSVGHGMRNH